MERQTRYQSGDKIAGRYQVHQVLLGGMGEVTLCLDLEQMVPFTLKTFQRRYLGDPQRPRRVGPLKSVNLATNRERNSCERRYIRYHSVIDFPRQGIF